MKRRLIIDADVSVYAVALGEQKTIEWDNTLHTVHAHSSTGIARIDDDIKRLAATLKADSVSLFLSDPDPTANFRARLVDPEYKAHRKMKQRPLLWQPLRDHLMEEWGAKWYPGLEGDDACAIFATAPFAEGEGDEERIIVSIDKDLLGTPGRLYNPDHPTDGVLTISLEEADRFHLFQTLVGDRVDGYPGVPGIGAVKAEPFLEAGWPGVVAAFESKGLPESEALRNARLARILRWGEYNFDTGEVTLWAPPKEESE